ncbi:MAG: hypothetical protein WCI48_12010 [Bacteroidota bacterium]
MDTLLITQEFVTRTEVFDFYKDFLEKQTNTYNLLITTFIGISVIIVGSTWLWNFIVAKKQIKNEVVDAINSVKEEYKTAINSSIEVKLKEFEESIAKKLKLNEANLARLYALNCSNQNLNSTSVTWWITALELYSQIEEQVFLRISVEQILYNLNQENWFNDWQDTFDAMFFIDVIDKNVPVILDSEKRRIIQILGTKIRN